MKIRCIAFDCFGTVFDMSNVSREEIRQYVEHVKRNDFSPFAFPQSWLDLQPHPDSAEGLRMLADNGFACVAMSNGSVDLLQHISERAGIRWANIMDLAKHQRYKPHPEAYRVIEQQAGYAPAECLMVTANPTFGDIEGSAAIGMRSQVIRQPGEPQTIVDLAAMLIAA